MELTEQVFLSLSEEDRALIKGRSNNKGKTDLYTHLRHVLVDQFVAWELDERLCTGIHMSKGAWKQGRYNALHLSYRITDLIRVMERNGYLDIAEGSHHREGGGRNRVTRIKPTDRLLRLFRNLTITREDITFHKDEEVIILRYRDDDRSRQIKYEDSPETMSMRAEVQAYNEMMSRHYVDVASLQFPYYDRKTSDRFGEEKIDRIWITQDKKFVRRTFSRGSFEKNGRWNGGFWQNLPKAYRRDIWIDGEATDEVDYSGLHPSILALQMGERFDGDPYDLGRQVLDGISLEEQRSVVKKLVLYAVNAKTLNKAYQAFMSDNKGYKKADLKLLLEAYVDRNPFMVDTLGSDKGIDLMYLDSQIAAKVINWFVEADQPILPIHDSFIIASDEAAVLESVMEDACFDVLGGRIEMESRQGKEIGKRDSHPTVPFFDNEQGEEAYQSRWVSWLHRHPNAYFPDLIEE